MDGQQRARSMGAMMIFLFCSMMTAWLDHQHQVELGAQRRRRRRRRVLLIIMLLLGRRSLQLAAAARRRHSRWTTEGIHDIDPRRDWTFPSTTHTPRREPV